MRCCRPVRWDSGPGLGVRRGWLIYFFLSFADPDLSWELHRSLTRQCYRFPAGLGFGAIREYPPSAPGGFGDVDSGPVILGYGTSGTGFALAGARIHGDRKSYAGIVRTAHLFGAPVHRDGRTSFVTGGPLGNAILLAMLTAPHRPDDAAGPP